MGKAKEFPTRAFRSAYSAQGWHLRRGFALVLCFSIGLAITLVAVGATAALSVRHATKRWPWFSAAARKAPYFSSILIIAIGLYVGYNGWIGLEAQAAVGATAPAGG